MIASMPTIGLTELVDEVERAGGGAGLYIRWSRGPQEIRAHVSKDALTGVELPGLSVSPLAVEPWWGEHPLRLWVARRLVDYLHLRKRRARGVRPWLLQGRETGRGPDNEPLVVCTCPIAWISDEAVRESQRIVDEEQGSHEWGPLDRG